MWWNQITTFTVSDGLEVIALILIVVVGIWLGIKVGMGKED